MIGPVSRAARVPEALTRRPFRREEAAAVGLTRSQLGGKAWLRLYPNVFVAASLPMTPELWLEAVRLAVTDGMIAFGPTAAWLHGVLHPRPGQRPDLHLASPRGAVHLRRPDVVAARLALDEQDVTIVDGVRVTSPARTCYDLARTGSTVDGVVGVDAFMSAGLVSADRMWRFCAERRRWPGIDRLRGAVLLGSDRVRSPAESRLRMLLVLNGLPEPLVNAPLHDAHGNLLGIPDLLYLEPLLGIEYDGSYHGAGEVRQADLIRENRLVTHGLPLLRYCSYHLGPGRRQVLDEVSRALRRTRCPP